MSTEPEIAATSASTDRPTVFVAYNAADETFKQQFVQQLGVLARQNLLNIWDDSSIEPGTDTKGALSAAIGRASVAVLLLSADFLNCDLAVDYQVPQILARCERHGLFVVSILLRPFDVAAVDWIKSTAVRPRAGKKHRFVTQGNDSSIEYEFSEVAREIRCMSIRPTVFRSSVFTRFFRYVIGEHDLFDHVGQSQARARADSIVHKLRGTAALATGLGGFLWGLARLTGSLAVFIVSIIFLVAGLTAAIGSAVTIVIKGIITTSVTPGIGTGAKTGAAAFIAFFLSGAKASVGAFVNPLAGSAMGLQAAGVTFAVITASTYAGYYIGEFTGTSIAQHANTPAYISNKRIPRYANVLVESFLLHERQDGKRENIVELTPVLNSTIEDCLHIDFGPVDRTRLVFSCNVAGEWAYLPGSMVCESGRLLTQNQWQASGNGKCVTDAIDSWVHLEGKVFCAEEKKAATVQAAHPSEMDRILYKDDSKCKRPND